MKLSIAALCLGSAAAFSSSSFSGTALKASANDAAVTMETGMGINGFGRIGRLGKLSSMRTYLFLWLRYCTRGMC